MDFVRNLLKGDKYIWGIFFTLCIISGVEIFSATSTLAYKAAAHYNPVFSHLTHLIFGAIGTIVVLNMPPHFFRGIGYMIYPFAIILLVGVMFTPEVNGANRHLFGFQPSEIAKFATISVACALLARGQTEDGITKNSYIGIILTSGFVLILIAVENMSTAILLGGVIFCLMFIAHVQSKRLLSIIGIGAGMLMIGLLLMFTLPNSMLVGRTLTWKNRIVEQFPSLTILDRGQSLTSLNEKAIAEKKLPKVEQTVNDKNRQVQYGHMAIANGGIFGKGPGNSQIRDFLPQAYSDFIYSIIIEESGLVGGSIVLLLYIALIIRAGIIFRRCKKSYPGLLILGVTMLIVFQALINMAVGVDLMPVTGQPLPLISRGGTSIILTCLYFGIILSISRSVEEVENPVLSEEEAIIKELNKDDYNPNQETKETGDQLSQAEGRNNQLQEEEIIIEEKDNYPY